MQGETGIVFHDIAGIDEATAELRQIVAFLRDVGCYRRPGGRMLTGLQIVGAPGTGKTLLAKPVAGEAGVPLFSVSGAGFVEMSVGVGAARVRDLFEQARAQLLASCSSTSWMRLSRCAARVGCQATTSGSRRSSSCLDRSWAACRLLGRRHAVAFTQLFTGQHRPKIGIALAWSRHWC